MSLQALFPTISASLPTATLGALSSAEDFETLGLALDAAGLTGTVAGLEGATIFAPTDAAFASLATSLGFEGDTDDSGAVFAAIAGALGGLAPDGDPIPLLTDILLYHVSPDQQDTDALNGQGEVATLLEGTAFEVTGGKVIDADTDALNAEVISTDVVAGANTVQVVDQVLLPIDTPIANADPSLLGLLEESGGTFDDDATDFDLLLNALQATGLDVAADDEDGELTVFLPNDGAFVSLAQGIGYEGEDEGEAFQAILDASADADPENPLALVTDILTYHISPGAQDAEAVLAADEIETLNGATIAVDGTTLVDLDDSFADPNLIATDIEASNGIAHVLDGILLPADLGGDDEDTSLPMEEEVVADDDDDGGFGTLLLGLGLIGLLAFAGSGFM
jgi:uncharacterized surface protein with fasciclin (FAS1) repeats